MSFSSLLLLAFLALLVFEPKKLPEIARTVGKLMTELRRASHEFQRSLTEEIQNLDYQQQLARPVPPAVEGTVTAVSHPALPTAEDEFGDDDFEPAPEPVEAPTKPSPEAPPQAGAEKHEEHS